jgi:hypothetical protein
MSPACCVLSTAFCLLCSSGPEVNQANIAQAIERGVAHVKQQQQADGSWFHEWTEGATALAALTLLECDVDSEDPAIQKAAAYLRQGSVSVRKTYSIALTILFFDRLGKPTDVPLIESLGRRLVAGQNAYGGWTYYCPEVDQSEGARLSELLRKADTPAGKRALPFPGAGQPVAPFTPPILQGAGDNSNTQFATLGLWVARRHGVPADAALARLERRCRESQQLDGGWPYTWAPGKPIGNLSTPAMTCSGLLGLAVAQGMKTQTVLRNQRKKAENNPGEAAAADAQELPPIRDSAIYKGLAFVGQWVDGPGSQGIWQPFIPAAVPGAAGLVARANPSATWIDYYCLWSLERVSMAFGRRVIGHRDWFSWGAEILLTAQQFDGAWRGRYAGSGIDTCFALLFLTRSNLAPDLTATLKGRIRDGEVRLRSGGIGSEDFRSSGKEKTAAKPPRFGPDLVMPGQRRAGPNREAKKTSDTESPESAKLSDEVVKASPEQQPTLISKLRDGKGVMYTEALAQSIARLTGVAKAEARDALAQRLTHMAEGTLAEKLQDDNPEVRRAACLASAMKETKRFIPDLVRLLEDREALVTRAAHRALTELTGEDLGPSPVANAAEREQAIRRWKEKWGGEGKH